MTLILNQRNHLSIFFFNRFIDRTIFNSSSRKPTLATKPILLCVSEVESNLGLEDFCSIETVGTKILVGDGPYLPQLKEQFQDVIFTGCKTGPSLAHYYANADVLVYTVKNNTISYSLFESIACGTPIACYPTESNLNFINQNVNGELDDNLSYAIGRCLGLNRLLVEKSSYDYESNFHNSIFRRKSDN